VGRTTIGLWEAPMKHWMGAALMAGVLVFTALPAHAQCGGICLYENGLPELGRAAAGAGARAQDASTAFWNPAGMTELEGREVLLGVIASFGKLNPDLNAGTVTPDPQPWGGGNASGFAPLLGGYFSTELPYGIHFGLASTALYGGFVDYDCNWTGRGYVVDASLLSFLIQPSLAYSVTDWLSLGAGPRSFAPHCPDDLVNTLMWMAISISSKAGLPSLLRPFSGAPRVAICSTSGDLLRSRGSRTVGSPERRCRPGRPSRR
jgi:long-subunit fatty acid transport protein